MDDHNVLFAILQYAWIGLIAVIAWLVKKVYKVEDDASTEEAAVGKDIAVLQTHQKGLRSEFDKEMKRNAIDHDKILERLDQHNVRVMTRLDSLLTIAKNGSK